MKDRMTDPEMDDFDEALDDGIGAVILDRMTDTHDPPVQAAD